MILIPLEPLISPFTTWFSITLTGLSKDLRPFLDETVLLVLPEYKHALIPFLTRNT